MSARCRTRATPSVPTTIHQARFPPRPLPILSVPLRESAGRLPRITRLLALAHRIEGMIRAGDLHDWAVAARLLGLTRGRMTQIANLLLLAPEIQGSVLSLPRVRAGGDRLTEHRVRALSSLPDWAGQSRLWESLVDTLISTSADQHDPTKSPASERHA